MITPVVLTGGAGKRLWPLSRKSFPKQFQTLGADQTLLQATLARVTGNIFTAPIVITGEDFRFICQDQMAALGDTPGHIFIEPEGRDTAPAVLLGTLAVAATDPKGLVLVLPSDHRIPDVAAFQTMITAAIPAAQAGQIITFGIPPDRPETGYGYLALDTDTGAGAKTQGPVPLAGFIEKPDHTTAERLVASGTHLWNAGIFLFRADVMQAAFDSHAPDLVAPVTAAFAGGEHDLGFLRLAADPWQNLRSVSVDYAIMEQADNLCVQRFEGHWSDLGSWDAMWRDAPRTADDVALVGGALDVGSENSLLFRDDSAPEVIGIGLTDALVVATKDAVLVADLSQTENIKQAVDHLTQMGQVTATQTPQVYRPWGWYETLALGGRFQVKRIVVKPGGILSLQSHVHRSEHWIVVEGTAKVTIDDHVQLISENQSVYIPLGAVHRMENPGKLPMVLIEVQTGSYLGEDDITRYEDAYRRPKHPNT